MLGVARAGVRRQLANRDVRGLASLVFAVLPGLAINSAATIDAPRRAAPGPVLVAERRAPEPAAHAAAPLAHAAMARLVQLLSRWPGCRLGEVGGMPPPDRIARSADGFDGRTSAIVDHARPHPGRAGDRMVCDRGGAHGPGDDLPAVPDGHRGPRTGLDPDLGPSRDALADRDPGSGGCRAAVLATGFLGDWLLVVATVGRAGRSRRSR